MGEVTTQTKRVSPPRKLSGRPAPELDQLVVALLNQTQRRRRSTAGTSLGRVQALAADPHLYELAAVVTAGNQRDHSIGGALPPDLGHGV